MKSKLKIVVGILGSLVVITLVTLLILRYLVTKSFPVVDGTIVVAGLQNPVTVQRDEFGIPHITAGNEHDLFCRRLRACSRPSLANGCRPQGGRRKIIRNLWLVDAEV